MKTQNLRHIRHVLTRFKTGPELRNWKPGQPYLVREAIPLRAPHRLARVAPFPWRGFAALLVLVAIAAALFILSR